ncbi:MAG: hypothetical protein OXG44_06115 [Gammaproteobacteria bacterium]|nr:hypothetical protein [Gammaproteobacteria bacterium]
MSPGQRQLLAELVSAALEGRPPRLSQVDRINLGIIHAGWRLS